MRLHDLRAPKGANRSHKRVGRGESSGWGKFSGRGSGGQGQRSGTGKPSPGFEGGQTPMYRRMPKRGFVNIFAKRWATINLDILALRFASGTTVDMALFRKVGLASKSDDGVRILGRGDLPHPLNITADHFTASARLKIEEAGGQAILYKRPTKKDSKKDVEQGK
jgi:large subunit ribosomal protein L15